MKRMIALALGLVAPALSLFGQGHVLISNYAVAPYNQVVYIAGVGPAVNDPTVRLAFFYAPGVVLDQGQLGYAGAVFGVNPALTYDPGRGFGPGGYYDTQLLVTPTAGLYTVELRWDVGFGGFMPGVGTGLFQVMTTSTSLPAEIADVSPWIGFMPEPSTASLLCIGSLGMWILRRQKSSLRCQQSPLVPQSVD